jgi:hypothetical protein
MNRWVQSLVGLRIQPTAERSDQYEPNHSPAVTADIEICGRIIFKHSKRLLTAIASRPTSQQAGRHPARHLFHQPSSIFGVVADYHGQVVGSNFLDEATLSVAWARLLLTRISSSVA